MKIISKHTPQECRDALQAREKKISLAQAHFTLVPPALMPTPGFDPDLKNIQALYKNCWETVFENSRCDRLLQSDRVASLATEAQCSVRMFILAIMLSYKNSPQPFYASMLTGPQALTRLHLQRQECCRQFGTFDTQKVILLNTQETAAHPDLLASEVLAGSWIVGHKLKCSGSPFSALFQSRELAFHPLWLALEPSYLETILKPYWQNPQGTQQIQRHRFRVSRLLAQLKKDTPLARKVFAQREALVPEAVRTVLNYYRLVPEDFEIPPFPITEMVPFWSRLGLALQQYYCLRWIGGDDEARDRIT